MGQIWFAGTPWEGPCPCQDSSEEHFFLVVIFSVGKVAFYFENVQELYCFYKEQWAVDLALGICHFSHQNLQIYFLWDRHTNRHRLYLLMNQDPLEEHLFLVVILSVGKEAGTFYFLNGQERAGYLAKGKCHISHQSLPNYFLRPCRTNRHRLNLQMNLNI